MEKIVELSRRMQAAADMVSSGNRVCDVGCDHGYVSIWLLKNGICPRVIAMDVRKGPLAAAEEHIAKLLRRGGQHADLFIAAVSRSVHIGEGMIDGKRLVPSGVHGSCDRQQQYEQHGKGGQRLLPAQPELQRLRSLQGKAEDRGEQRQQEKQDPRQIAANAVEDLRAETLHHILAHADLIEGHEVSENVLIDQLHLGQQHLCRDQENPCDLAQNLWQT